ncbi:MAG: hypothetical protein ACI9Y1_002610 [Lentisphaeria bacterium]|jgi:uncharacterized protein YcbX
MTALKAEIKALYVYPVKSLSGIAVDSAMLTASGLQYDRQWAIFREDGFPLTQRKEAAMARIQATITGFGLSLSVPSEPSLGHIDVSAPDAEIACEPFNVWKDICVGQVASGDVNNWLCEALKSSQKLKLARTHPGALRQFDCPERFKMTGQSFSDAAPYLIANRASLDALNVRLKKEGQNTVNMLNFRPNIVISGPPAFSEHAISRMSCKSDEIELSLVDHCQRCIMITVNPDKGEFQDSPSLIKALAKLNSMPHSAKAPAFGVNSTLTRGDSRTIQVGQTYLYNTLP